MPVVTWHTESALHRTSGFSADRPGTLISRVSFSGSNHTWASGRNMLMIRTLGAIWCRGPKDSADAEDDESVSAAAQPTTRAAAVPISALISHWVSWRK